MREYDGIILLFGTERGIMVANADACMADEALNEPANPTAGLYVGQYKQSTLTEAPLSRPVY